MTPMTTTKTPRYVYSVFRNDLEPSWINPAICFILSVPASLSFTYLNKNSPIRIEIIEDAGAISHASTIAHFHSIS